jgi:hypothetical protein
MKKLLLFLFVGLTINAFAQHPCVPPAVTISGTSWKCKGVSDTLSLSGPSATTYLWSDGNTTTSIITGPIEADSTFYVIANNGGCIDTTYFNVTVKIPPVVNINHIDSICAGNGICLSPNVSGTGPFTFLWSPGGKTSDTICVNPVIDMVYTVTVSNGCTTTKMDTVVLVNCTGINNITASPDFINIYPNPSSTEFTMSLPAKAVVNVFDITGRMLFSEMEKPGTVTFGKELTPGIYFLFIDGKPEGKLVKL